MHELINPIYRMTLNRWLGHIWTLEDTVKETRDVRVTSKTDSNMLVSRVWNVTDT
jgi:hypothetical protein